MFIPSECVDQAISHLSSNLTSEVEKVTLLHKGQHSHISEILSTNQRLNVRAIIYSCALLHIIFLVTKSLINIVYL